MHGYPPGYQQKPRPDARWNPQTANARVASRAYLQEAQLNQNQVVHAAAAQGNGASQEINDKNPLTDDTCS